MNKKYTRMKKSARNKITRIKVIQMKKKSKLMKSIRVESSIE